MTAYTRTAILIVTAADQAAANAQAVSIDPDTGGASTFEIPLSALGENPATHYGAHGELRETTLADVEALHASTFPDGMIYRGLNPYDDEPAVTRYTFAEALADAGLVRIQPAMGA